MRARSDATSSSVDAGVVAQSDKSNEEPRQLPTLTHLFSAHLKPIFTLLNLPVVEEFRKENWWPCWANMMITVNEKKKLFKLFPYFL